MTGQNHESADLKLVDFGFAAKCDGYSLTNQCGTPAYVAPEIIRKHPHGMGRVCVCLCLFAWFLRGFCMHADGVDILCMEFDNIVRCSQISFFYIPQLVIIVLIQVAFSYCRSLFSFCRCSCGHVELWGYFVHFALWLSSLP